MTRATSLAAAVSLALLAGCRTEQTLKTPDISLERMLEQQKVRPYEPDGLLPEGMAMQPIPEGAVPHDTPAAPAVETTGVKDGRWAARIPIRIDRPLVEDGRRDFETFCAACHGILGDGRSVVASKMNLRPPQDLLDPEVRAYSPGRLFQTVREGYGLMPSYAVQLSVRDTWGVVAYVRALQLSRGVHVAELPADVRSRLAREAP